MRQATSQEPVSDSGHSRILESSESNGSSSLKSAAMLGIALSVGASGALIPSSDATAATHAHTPSATTEAFSSDNQAATDPDALAPRQIVGYHTIGTGESLWQIAQQHRVGLQELKSANALAPETSISVGQVLKVPAATPSAGNLVQTEPVKVASVELENVLGTSARSSETANTASNSSNRGAVLKMTVTPELTPTVEIADASVEPVQQASSETEPVVTAYAATSRYQVRSGDTLRSIASSLGTTPEEIVRANSLIDPDVIFVGSTLVVPAGSSAAQPSAKRASRESAEISQERPAPSVGGERLAHLRGTATAPESARILEEIRTASPEEAVSVGGEEITEQDLLGSIQNTESRDPYVANLLAEVEEIRTQSVQVSEAESVEIESDFADSTESALIASANAADRISRLNVPGRESAPNESSASELQNERQADRPEAGSDLLAAAPLSPDAYIPAQRSAGQVVSPDMPLLPSEEEYLPDAPDYFDGYVWPTQGTVTSNYGWRWGRMHRGVDVAGPVGTPIVAAAVGVVERAGWTSGGYGNIVEIRHPDGSLTRYAHNNSVSVSAGQSVKQGQQIAEMGSTGYSTGPHLHFEVHQDGAAVNPVAYLPSR